MTALFCKFKSSVSQNKKFFLVYLIVILAVVLSLISLSILGSIERTGYLTGFNKILDNYYACRINYYSSIFRNSDIYGVYPYFTNNYTYTPGNEYGTPFGSAFINKELKDNDRVDIQYKLKLKYNIIFFSIIFLLLFPILYLYVIPNIIKNYKYYILLFFINSAIYLIIPIILKQFSIVTIRYHYADIVLSFIFLMIAFNLLNNKLLYTLLFEIINIFSFFVIQPLGLTFQNNILLFTDMPNLYFSLLAVSSFPIKILLIISSIIYFSLILFIIISSIYYLVKRKNKIASSIMIIMIIILVYTVFFRKTDVNLAWPNIIGQAYRNGIIDTINYRINYDRIRNVKYSREDVLNAVNTLKNFEEKRDYSNLILQSSTDNKRDVFLIFLESFYDYSHFTNLFEKDPFPEEYRKWANNSRKIPPNSGSGSFYARLAGLTASSPLYQNGSLSNINNTLPDLLVKNNYETISLEEAGHSYNLENFLPAIGFQHIVFGLGSTNIDTYIENKLNKIDNNLFVYGFTFLGHTESHIENDFNIKKNNEKFFSYFEDRYKYNLIETMDNSVMAAIEVIKTRDTILKYHPNALIIFKHDHLYPYLRGIIENSSIDNDIKMSFLNDNAPTPILIWDGTNGAYKAPDNFVPENIPMFIALNAGVTNYKNSIISLLYKEEIDGFISTYHKYYRITNDTLLLENNIDETSKIFKYENAQRILSQDIFQGRKYYYDLIKEYTNN